VKKLRHTLEGLLTKARFATRIVLLGTVILLAARAQATVTNIVWYRLGENDPGASPGAVATNTVDFVSGHNLTFFGPATYSSDVSTSAIAHTGSSLSVDLASSILEL
jgi:hypothetical protein